METERTMWIHMMTEAGVICGTCGMNAQKIMFLSRKTVLEERFSIRYDFFPLKEVLGNVQRYFVY